MYRYVFILLGFVILGFWSTSANAQTYTTSDGHDFTVSLTPDKDTIMLGETTILRFEVKNLSKTELYFPNGGDYRNRFGRPESYDVSVVRDDGKPVPKPDAGLSFGGLMGLQSVPVDGKFVEKLFLSHWATFDGPGTYTVTVTKAFAISGNEHTPGNVFDRNLPRAVATKVQTRIRIVETDSEKLGGVIRDLGSSVVSKNTGDDSRDDLLLLDFIKDDRTIPYWIEAVQIYSKTSDSATQWRYGQTPMSLAKYNTTASINALEAAMKSKTDDVRLAVADALGFSANIYALPLLLSMQDDPYYFVRLRVAQALGNLKTDESTGKLLDMLKDENQDVREEVERFLRARNKLPEKLPSFPISALDCSVRQSVAVRSLQTLRGKDCDKSGSSSVFLKTNCASALDAFLKEFAEDKATNNTFGEAWVLYQIGDIYHETRRYQEAHDYYVQALPLFKQLKNDGQRQVLSDLGGVSESLKNYADALDYMNKELSLVRGSDNKDLRSDEGRILDRIANVYFESGDDAKGIEYLNKRLSFEREHKNEIGEAITLNSLGAAHEKKGKKDEALNYYQNALDIYEREFSKGWLRDFYEETIKELRESITRLKPPQE